MIYLAEQAGYLVRCEISVVKSPLTPAFWQRPMLTLRNPYLDDQLR